MINDYDNEPYEEAEDEICIPTRHQNYAEAVATQEHLINLHFA